MKQSPWVLVLFIAIGVVGLALVGFGVWLVVQSNQLEQAQPAPVPQKIPTPGIASGMIIITATLDSASSSARAPASELAGETNLKPSSPAELSPTPTPLIPWNPCPGSYLSRLRPGYRASVSLKPPLPNNVREKPDQTSKFLFAIQPGELVDIVVGPECSAGWVWWQIQTTGGKTGWTSEGDGKDYWLVPVQ